MRGVGGRGTTSFCEPREHAEKVTIPSFSLGIGQFNRQPAYMLSYLLRFWPNTELLRRLGDSLKAIGYRKKSTSMCSVGTGDSGTRSLLSLHPPDFPPQPAPSDGTRHLDMSD